LNAGDCTKPIYEIGASNHHPLSPGERAGVRANVKTRMSHLSLNPGREIKIKTKIKIKN
jgi:hypothetical protein